MLKVPQLNKQLKDIGGEGFDRTRISEITLDGKRIDVMAEEYFGRGEDDEDGTAAITDACRAIYRVIVNCGSWRVSALTCLWHGL